MQRIAALYLAVAVLFVPACGNVGDAPPADTVVLPGTAPEHPVRGSWPQFHGGTENHGSLFIPSDYALEPKWTVDVGPVVYSSPVVGGNGVIYLGNQSGELIAVTPAGLVQWRINLTGMINSSPAVSDSGFIYVVSTELDEDDRLRSTLNLVTPQGALLRSTPLPNKGFSTSSPKVWRSGNREFVFLYARRGFDSSSLLIFSKAGLLIHQEDMACQFPVTGSTDWGPIGTFFEVVWDVLWKDGPGIDFDPGGVLEDPLYERYGWIDPTVAIVDTPGVTTPDQPLVLLVDKACFLKGYRWNAPTLTEIWSMRHTSNSADKLLFQSSPAVIKDSNKFVLGAIDGTVRAHDLQTGAELWKVKFADGVMGTPASLGGLVYVASEAELRALDMADGSTVFSQHLSDKSVASPLLSGSKVYISQRNELLTLNFNFTTAAHAGAGSGGGLVSPAIGADGTIYSISLLSDTALLKAYGGAGVPLLAPDSDTLMQ